MRNKHQWDHQKLRIKVPFVKFVEFPDGNYIILGGSPGILVDKVA